MLFFKQPQLKRLLGNHHLTPAFVKEMVSAGRGEAAGAIISWDLMHAPIDGLEALAASVEDLV
jgi:hypothetical protein